MRIELECSYVYALVTIPIKNHNCNLHTLIYTFYYNYHTSSMLGMVQMIAPCQKVKNMSEEHFLAGDGQKP